MRYSCCIISQEEPEQSLFFMLNALLQALVDIGDEVVAGTILARLEIPEMVAEEERLMKLVAQAKAQAETKAASTHAQIFRAR